MILIHIKGGLGNQMFQYAFGRTLAIKKATELKLDIHNYKAKDIITIQNDTERKFLLDKFHINAAIADNQEIKKYNSTLTKLARKIRNKLFGFRNHYVYDPREFEVSKNSYLEGYWQSEKYFKDSAETIRNEFTLKNPLGDAAVISRRGIESAKASGSATASLHVRRSDYATMPVNARFFGTCDKAYYERAFAEIKRKLGAVSIELFIFSDDIEWAKKNLSFSSPMHFVTNGAIADYEELVLMCMCDHHIIANSSFSWWGAWLNPSRQKIVVAPKKWLANDAVDTSDVVPEDWLRI